MLNKAFKRLLPFALAVLASAPAFAQVQVHVGVGPFEVHFAQDAPPPMRQEYRTPRPSPDHVWIGGFWDRDGDRWAWREGRWDRPERRDVRWVAPVYRGEGGGYRYEPGHWSNQQLREGDSYRRFREQHGRGHEKGRPKGYYQD